MEDDGNADTSTYYIFIPWYKNSEIQKLYEYYVNFKYIGRSPCFPLNE